MKIMQGSDVLVISINKILTPDWDVRLREENESGLKALANSIKVDGFINPITCIREGDKYKIIAGRRRFKAAKLIGLTEVPIYVKDDITSEDMSAKRVALIENVIREDMADSERAYAFYEIFKMAGYTKKQVLKGVKSIDNWFAKNPDKNWNNLQEEIISSSFPKSDKPTNPLRYDIQFIETCRDIPLSPKYQYQLMEILEYLTSSVLKLAEKVGLSTAQKIDLTMQPLRDHPKIQKELIHEIEHDIPKDLIHERIKEVSGQLADGTLKALSSGEYVRVSGEDEEIIKEGNKILEPIQIQNTRLRKAAKQMIFRLTGRALTHGEYSLDRETIDGTINYRWELVKSSDTNSLSVLQEILTSVHETNVELLNMIHEEMLTREKQQELITK